VCLTSAAGPDVADGMIQGSKIKGLCLKGNRLGIHTAGNGQALQVFKYMYIYKYIYAHVYIFIYIHVLKHLERLPRCLSICIYRKTDR
jgi:hypothetical protein